MDDAYVMKLWGRPDDHLTYVMGVPASRLSREALLAAVGHLTRENERLTKEAAGARNEAFSARCDLARERNTGILGRLFA